MSAKAKTGPQEPLQRRIAVVGSGISGLSAAWLLHRCACVKVLSCAAANASLHYCMLHAHATAVGALSSRSWPMCHSVALHCQPEHCTGLCLQSCVHSPTGRRSNMMRCISLQNMQERRVRDAV